MWPGALQQVTGNPSPKARGAAARRILGRLLAAPGRRIGQGRLLDDLWPDTDSKGNVDNGLTALRAVIGKELIQTIDLFYEMADQSLVWVGIDACEALLKQAENQHQDALTIPLLEEALGYLERGEYLEGEDGTWCYGLRHRPEEMLRQCRRWLAEGYESQGKFWQAGEQYRALCQLFPPDEDALCAWMAMLARQGKHQDALRHYREVQSFFEEQDFLLSSATRQLATQIEAQHREESFSASVPFPLNQAAFPWPLSFYEGIELANSQEIVYDSLETEIMAVAYQWKQAIYPIALLQQSIYTSLRKHDIVREDYTSQRAKISRRYALQTIAQFPIQMYGLAFLVGSQHLLPPAEEFLPLCAASLTACLELRQYEPEGWITIRRVLVSYLPTIEKFAHQSSSTKQTAAHLAAQGYLLFHTLADHYGKRDQMETAARRARYYGQLANDPNLEASALIRLAVKFAYEHRDLQSLTTYKEALARPEFKKVSPLLQGRVYAGLAGMSAYCNQEALPFLDMAREVFPQHPEEDISFQFAYCVGSHLPLWEGLTYKYLGNYTEAINAFLCYGSLSPRAGQLELYRSEHLNYAAASAVEQYNLDAAYLYLETAEEIAWAIQHEQRLAEVRDTLRSMQLIWPREPKVKQLQEKIYAREN